VAVAAVVRHRRGVAVERRRAARSPAAWASTLHHIARACTASSPVAWPIASAVAIVDAGEVELAEVQVRGRAGLGAQRAGGGGGHRLERRGGRDRLPVAAARDQQPRQDAHPLGGVGGGGRQRGQQPLGAIEIALALRGPGRDQPRRGGQPGLAGGARGQRLGRGVAALDQRRAGGDQRGLGADRRRGSSAARPAPSAGRRAARQPRGGLVRRSR
jgi:hypothetical protein